MKVLVYGSLRRGMGNHVVLANHQPKFLGTVTVNGYAMYDVCGGGFPGIRPVEGASVVCELYEVDAAGLESLDWLEGYRESDEDNSHYLRRTELIDGEPAYIYVYNAEVSEYSHPRVEQGDWVRYKETA